MKIALLTTSRADYSFLLPLIKEIKKNKIFKLSLIICGTHLSKKHGYTIKEIEDDKVKVNYKINSIENNYNIIGSIIKITSGFSRVILKIKPDLIFLPADRYEILAAANVALLHKIPIAHYGGGQITKGAWDNSIRHAVSKISHIHFVSTVNCKKKLIQMGENPKNVFICGSLGIDNIKSEKILKKKYIEKKINFKLDRKFAVVTFHSETLSTLRPEKIFTNLLKSLEKFRDLKVIFTCPNIDEKNKELINQINRFVKKNSKKSIFVPSLGRSIYLSCINYASVIIGNSSSGIIEAPSFRVPVVNIGERQRGRIISKNIIMSDSQTKNIVAAIKKSFNNKFLHSIRNLKNPYGNGTASKKIVKELKRIKLKNILKKEFYEIKF